MGANVVIGGTDYPVPPMNFAALKAAWADIKGLPMLTDPVDQASAGIRIVAAALKSTAPDLTAEAIEQKLAATEFPALVSAVVGILRESGLIPTGEPIPQAGSSMTSTT
ncbi:hypothetical protein FBZ89_10671 [Nitrospirillum amazonense]|uniref:Uncharacterized protein n=1 Tax=Nitrospirillum amazonense TaxID=28077 RepID=A0A560FGD5_9PROT|nr:hypothetical protein [Nitrospirillum amazonense]TWB20672.1 hypothetical protein FBZ89_10671 [Nitrospirillum amazonense]